MRKLSYFVACSLDGFIGDPEGDATSMFSFLDEEFLGFLKENYPEAMSAQGRAALGIADLPPRRFDTVIQGRGSYQAGLDAGITSPYAHLREYVVSHSLQESPDPHVTLIDGDVRAAVRKLKEEDGELGIWLCGGARLAGELREDIDELIIKTYPQVYGSGTPMFRSGFSVDDFALDEVQVLGNGVLVRTYSRKR
ncbi:dihydrofolate reductase family protein [Streptomyces sp. NPDC049954]|uniref:dihydrofolate reductase family protein n=1 Tax=Streptomyces sp. NPDC049954 TaxID=3155779 RepID=UPI003446CDA2